MSPLLVISLPPLAPAGQVLTAASYRARDGYSGYTQVSPDHGSARRTLEPSTAKRHRERRPRFLICPLDLGQARGEELRVVERDERSL